MAVLFILTCLCFLAPTHQTPHPNATISDLAYKNLDFAMNLYRKIAGSSDKNIFFSPLSISTSFAALSMASDGVTREEILKVLNLKQLAVDHQPELIPKLFQLLQANVAQNGSLKLDQSTALFIHQHCEVEGTFTDRMKKFFHADIKTVDFTDTEGSIRFVNEYVKQKTENKIPEMISTLDETTQLLLINSIFFQGELNHCLLISVLTFVL